MPPGSLHGSTSSLNDFDHTPGSRPRPFDYRGPLSQGSLEDHYWDYREHPRPPEHFGHPPYNYSGPPGGPHGGPFNYEGGYGEPPPHERHSRSMQGGVRGHSGDFSPGQDNILEECNAFLASEASSSIFCMCFHTYLESRRTLRCSAALHN